jgi:hypothetical protein
MQGVVDGYLGSLRVGDGKAFDRMTLFPVFREGESGLRYLVLSEALANGSVEVRERPSATVPELWLVNRSEWMVLALDGEEVVGGKQNRIVNASFLVGAKSEVALPVTCVEHGRWHDVGPRFGSGESSYHSLRREKELQVRESLRAMGKAEANQGAVWDSIARKREAARAPSATGAMADIYLERGKGLEEYEGAFPLVEGAVGMAVALNGRMAGADLFDQAGTAAKVWGKLVRSYAMDAMDGEVGSPVARSRAERLLGRVRGARAEVFPSIGVGRDVRLEGDRATGAALAYEGSVVHLAIFRMHGRGSQGAGGMARASLRRRMQGRGREDA